MHAMMISVWRLAQCAVWIVAFVCATGLPEPGVYKFSDAMGKPIMHLTCLAGLTVYTCNLTQNFEFFMQLEKLLDIQQTLVINCSNKSCIQLKSILLKKGPCTCKLLVIRTNSLLQNRIKLVLLFTVVKVLPHFFLLLRSRYENATPNLCWVLCALLGVLYN